MKFFALKSLLRRVKQLRFGSDEIKSMTDLKREVLVRAGREQFKQLVEKGLSVPVALL